MDYFTLVLLTIVCLIVNVTWLIYITNFYNFIITKTINKFNYFKQWIKTMPLIKSKSKKAIGKNIKTEMAHGKGKKQSIAIALNTARKSGAKIPKKSSSKGGNIKNPRYK